jgi:hypothetical protein
MAEPYLIWSNEHRAWWRPDRCGYTTAIENAGRYDRAEACAIASNARGGWSKGKNPPEIALPEADAIEQAMCPTRYEAWANKQTPTGAA